jgi:DNA-binding NarL/FixJ family response regulator
VHVSDEVTTKPLRVVLADDSVLLREGVAQLLASRGMDVVDQVGDGEALLRSIDRDQPDVAVVDIRMPPTGTDEGLRAADELGVRHPQVGVLVLSEYLEPRYAERLLENGTPGRGYLLKETVTDLEAFFEAISRVAAGESVVDHAIVRRVVGGLRTRDPLDDLSDRERDILELMAAGRSNAAIAEALFVGRRTVETHIGNIFGKLALEEAPDDHRRVLAVLAYLGSR